MISFGFLAPTLSQADELSRFETARADYDAQRYRSAVKRFEALIQSSDLTNRPVTLESRKYLGACYLFLGQEKKAEVQFYALLRGDPEYVIDPATFPKAVLDSFDKTRARFLRDRKQAEERRVEREKKRRALEEQRRAMDAKKRASLLKLAQMETVERQNSRFVASIPFGVGQFQNEHRRLGIALATIQAVLGVLSITSFLLHQSLRDENPSEDSLDEANRSERAFRVTNWVSTGLLLGTMAAGIADAHIRFKPVVRTTRRRRLPEGFGTEKIGFGSRASAGMSLGLSLDMQLP